MSKILAALLLTPLAAGAAFAASALVFSALSNLKITFPLLLGAAAYCAAHFLPAPGCGAPAAPAATSTCWPTSSATPPPRC